MSLAKNFDQLMLGRFNAILAPINAKPHPPTTLARLKQLNADTLPQFTKKIQEFNKAIHHQPNHWQNSFNLFNINKGSELARVVDKIYKEEVEYRRVRNLDEIRNIQLSAADSGANFWDKAIDSEQKLQLDKTLKYCALYIDELTQKPIMELAVSEVLHFAEAINFMTQHMDAVTTRSINQHWLIIVTYFKKYFTALPLKVWLSFTIEVSQISDSILKFEILHLLDQFYIENFSAFSQKFHGVLKINNLTLEALIVAYQQVCHTSDAPLFLLFWRLQLLYYSSQKKWLDLNSLIQKIDALPEMAITDKNQLKQHLYQVYVNEL